MNRRTFVKRTALAAGTVMFLPSFVLEESFSKQELMGRVRPELLGDNFNLRKAAASAFERMRADAAKDGITLYSASSYRSYDHQNRIWTRKYKKYTGQGLSSITSIKKIVRYSTIPGTSRHHWGTDLDMIDLSKPTPADALLASNYQNGGVYEKLGAWLLKNANGYGFYETYTNDPNREGFEYEPWHYSYAPLAKPMLKDYLKLNIKEELLGAGLLGAASFTSDFIDQYIAKNIKGIHPFLQV